MNTRWRLIGSFLLIIIIALGTVAIVTRYTTEQEVEKFLGYGGQVGLENLADSLEAYYAENGSWEGVESVNRSNSGRGKGPRSVSAAGIGNHILANQSREIVYSSISSDLGTVLSEATLSQSIILEDSGSVVGYLLPDGGLLELPENFDALLIERVNRAVLIAALISGGLAILLSFILAVLIFRPIRRLTRAVKNLSAGDLSQRLSINDKGDLGTLGTAFNQMSASLQTAEKQRQALTADIAHELRNPLAIQRAHLEAIEDGLYPLDQENLALITEQNRHLTHLVEDLRTLALADAGELALDKQKVDLRKICQETLVRFKPQAKRKQIELSGNCLDEPLFVEADEKRLQQIQDNLMQNALRYTPNGGKIILTILDKSDRAEMRFYNNGPCISEQEMRLLFERFYRGDKARDRASGGTGLGLSIARKLAEAHDGSLRAENHPVEGVTFILSLPQ
jgi:two-component system OmpR family sensor kinase/two-component system sensor histidine kinase BaeS